MEAGQPPRARPTMQCGGTASPTSDSPLPPPEEHSHQVLGLLGPRWGQPSTLLGPPSQCIGLCAPLGEWKPMVTLLNI
jgi:hypothetical protein